MAYLNANIPIIECYVRGNYLRDQKDSHDKYFECVVFGVCSLPKQVPLFHYMMTDGGLWWRAPISAFCTKPGVKELPLNEQEIDKVLEFTQTSDEQTHKHLKFISHRSTAHDLIPQPDWLISSLIMKKTAFNISGFGGSGKSSLTMLLAITGAYHLPTFLDNNVPQSFSTLIMNQEDTLNQLKLKIKLLELVR